MNTKQNNKEVKSFFSTDSNCLFVIFVLSVILIGYGAIKLHILEERVKDDNIQIIADKAEITQLMNIKAAATSNKQKAMDLNKVCTAWWFDNNNVADARRKICGR
jgi:hypothetical protein